MNNLPSLISDLALIMLVAGITTLIFKKFNLPVVIGYILAGLLVGPVVSFLPTIADTKNIAIWSDIGVIFLLFSLGLEFSINKITSMGKSILVIGAIEISCMFLLGTGVAKLIHLSHMDAIFLGGMIAISSTSIIIKALDELGLRQKKFSELVFGILIIEDIAAIFILIILGTVAASKNIDGIALSTTLLKMMFYLIVWLIAGIYAIPTFLRKATKIITDETLLVMSLGICFGMVWLANVIGFSSALGAFMAGSILAGTIYSEKIANLFSPLKDLFGAIFFVSVGFLVEPGILVQYIIPILIIVVAVIVGKALFVSIGMLVSGQTLFTAVEGAFSMTQIGEFSFIIASLGNSLGVISDALYPIVVAVSIITTFLTPTLIKQSKNFYFFLNKILPKKWVEKLGRYRAEKAINTSKDYDWSKFLKGYFSRFLGYGIVILGIIILGINVLMPYLEAYISPLQAGITTCVVIYLCISPFISPLVILKKRYFTALWLKSFANHLPLIFLMVLRIAVAVFLFILPLYYIFAIAPWILIIIAIPVIYFISHSDWLIGKQLNIEAKFLSNLNQKTLIEAKSATPKDHKWINEQLYVKKFKCIKTKSIIHKNLDELSFSKQLHVKIIKIIRGKKHINIPVKEEVLHGDDIIYILGAEKQLENFETIMLRKNMLSPLSKMFTLREFVEAQEDIPEEQQLLCCAVKIDEGSELIGKNIKDSNIRDKWSCFLLGMERELYPIIDPNPNMILSSGDILWVIGTQRMASKLLAKGLV